MTDCYIILPMTCPSVFLRYMASVAIRTLRASTDARVLVMLNNTPNESTRHSVEKECKMLQINYKYFPGPFSQSKFWNEGRAMTDSEYVAYANQDCIFYPGWLDNMIELWREEPDYYALWPWSFCTSDMGLSYPNYVKYERRIQEHHHPATLLVLKRSSGYLWDEQFAFWEMDADFMLHCQRNNLKIGLCMASRVDHFSSEVTRNIDFQSHLGVEQREHSGESYKRMNIKREQCKTP